MLLYNKFQGCAFYSSTTAMMESTKAMTQSFPSSYFLAGPKLCKVRSRSLSVWSKQWAPKTVSWNTFLQMQMDQTSYRWSSLESPGIWAAFVLGWVLHPTSLKKAWSNSVTFKKWMSDVLLPHIRKKTWKNVILLTDNCELHCSDLVDYREQVHIVTRPPNFTSFYQPLAWK